MIIGVWLFKFDFSSPVNNEYLKSTIRNVSVEKAERNFISNQNKV